MEEADFISKVKNKITPNLVFNNPGGGISTIISISKNNYIRYKRGNSDIYISIVDIFNAYNNFIKSQCTTNKLKDFMPNVFNSKECNCTFFFLVLNKLSLCSEIMGMGVRQSPFYVEIF